jgi:serine/threonine protein kinase/tetratricopeptide (TPR) repeat protein
MRRMSSSDRHARLRALFDRAADLPPEERDRFLDRECNDDPEMRDELLRLFGTDEEEAALAGVIGNLARTSLAPAGGPEDHEGAEIGSYRLVRPIGEGGMGVVWEAEQLRPVRRTVAIKLIKWGMDTKRVMARFASEQQTLARMNHHAIAQVFDAGATPKGRPYFVMELVPGEPITEYCDSRKLSLASRVDLFIRVCRGVLHAHRKGVLHLDLKPSNLLVLEEEGQSVPKIIDFGIAKAIEQNLTQATLTMELGRVIGTPEYMSPEQAAGSEGEVDTRSDVYSLGVVLYRLLCGSLPHDWTRTESQDDIRKRLEQDPIPKPSRRLITLGTEAQEVAEGRGLEQTELRRALQNDLDWIVLRALERDPDRRYGSVTELAEDLERYLAHRPVLAGPPGAGYQASKFIRRHRVGVLAAAAVLLALSIGLATTSVALLRARSAEAVAASEAETAESVTTFLSGLFQASNPWEFEKGQAPDLGVLLDEAIRKVLEDRIQDPQVGIRLARELAAVAISLDRMDDAQDLVDKAMTWIDAGGDELKVERPEVLFLRARLAAVQWAPVEAEPLADAAIEAFLEVKGEDDPGYAKLLMLRGKLDFDRSLEKEAAVWYRQAIASMHSSSKLNLADLGAATSSLALCLSDPEERCRLAEEALAIHRKVYEGDHPSLAESMRVIASCALNQGNYHKALGLYEESHLMHTRALGAGHSTTLVVLMWVALTEYFVGDYDRTRERLEEGLAAIESETDHMFEAGLIYNMLAATCTGDSEFDRCRKAGQQAIHLFEASGGLGPAAAWVTRHNLAEVEYDAGNIAVARDEYRAIVDYRQNNGEDDFDWIPYLRDGWARAELALGDTDRANELAEQAVEGFAGSMWEPRYFARAWMTLATVRMTAGDPEGAKQAYRSAQDLYANVQGPPVVHDLRFAAAWHISNSEFDTAAAALDELRRYGMAQSVLDNDPLLAGIRDRSGNHVP